MNPCPKCGGIINVKLLKRRIDAPPIYSYTCADCGYSLEDKELENNDSDRQAHYRMSIPEDVKMYVPD